MKFAVYFHRLTYRISSHASQWALLSEYEKWTQSSYVQTSSSNEVSYLFAKWQLLAEEGKGNWTTRGSWTTPSCSNTAQKDQHRFFTQGFLLLLQLSMSTLKSPPTSDPEGDDYRNWKKRCSGEASACWWQQKKATLSCSVFVTSRDSTWYREVNSCIRFKYIARTWRSDKITWCSSQGFCYTRILYQKITVKQTTKTMIRIS